MEETFFCLLSIILRLFLANSELISLLKNVFVFKYSFINDSQSIVKTNFINSRFNIKNDYSFLSNSGGNIFGVFSVNSFLSRVLASLKEQDYNTQIFIFSVIDIANGKLLSKINELLLVKDSKKEDKETKQTIESKNNYILYYYLFNPISIMSCLDLQISNFYVFVLLVTLTTKTSLFLKNVITAISILLVPQNFFVLFFYTSYLNYSFKSAK